MNRRGFLSSIIAAAVALVTPKRPAPATEGVEIQVPKLTLAEPRHYKSGWVYCWIDYRGSITAMRPAEYSFEISTTEPRP